MKTLILYTTKFGFTKSCAREVHNRIKDSELEPLNEKSNLKEYDMILIGSYVLKSKLDEEVIEYIERNKRILRNKRFGMFVSGMNTEEFNQAVQDSIPAELFYQAEIVHCGGKVVMEKLSWKEKRVIKKRIGIKNDTFLDHKNKLDEFIKWANNETT